MSKPCRVLIIDDDPLILLTLSAYLEDSDYTVFKAGDGEEGLEVFARTQPDIVVTDLRMPKLDGFGVLAAIKAHSPATPVIAFTGTGERHATDEAVRLGAWCCLYKPLADLNDLIVAIMMALEHTDTGDPHDLCRQRAEDGDAEEASRGVGEKNGGGRISDNQT